ncbi:MAG: iron export ABC transporter permease subunit FetB [Candidatus Thorarchaeota archaeon]|nr:MAG: iron export ABC transporter permease subunit FetB [Candidatus Thorarchaeota archaeon]
MMIQQIPTLLDWLATLPPDVVNAATSYAIAMVLLVLLLLISKWQGLGVGNKLIVGTIRGTIQIILMALILVEIFALENLAIIFFVLFFMAAFAAYTVRGNLDHIPGVFVTSLPGIIAGGVGVMALATVLGIVEQTGEFIIPMGGMVIGNSMGMTSLVLDRMWSNAQKQRALVETALALGASPIQATEVTIRESIRSGMLPNLNRYASLGIVSIPGLMSGMIIGGANPVAAAFYQVIIFIMIFLSTVICGLIVSRLFLKHMFNEKLQLTVPPPAH